MFRHYLHIFYRNLLKNKLVLLVSLTSMAFSFAIALIVLNYHNYHHTFDTYAQKGHTIVRAYQYSERDNNRSLMTFAPLGQMLKDNDSRVKEFGRVYKWDMGVVSAEGQKFSQDIYYGDPSLLRIFPFTFISPEPGKKFEEVNTVILSESLARKYFGSTRVVGKVISFKDWFQEIDFEVVGVFKDMPDKMHFPLDILVSFSSLDVNPIWKGEVTNNWEANSFYTYFLIEGRTENVAQKLNSLAATHLPPGMAHIRFAVQNVEDIHLHSGFEDELAVNADKDLVNFLLLIGLLILVIAIINLVSFYLSNVVERIKEVGIKKSFGVSTAELRFQFLAEFIVFNSIALLLGGVVFYIIVQSGYLASLKTPGQTFDYSFWLLAGVVLFAALIISGVYPSMVIASIKLDSALNDKSHTIRKILMVFQYAISFGLIYTVIIVNAQFRFMEQQAVGFNDTNVMVLKAPSVIRDDSLFIHSLDYIKNELSQHHAVSAVSASSAVPGSAFRGELVIAKPTSEQIIKIQNFVSVDFDFNDVYSLNVIAGRFFSKDVTSDTESAVVINKTLGVKLGYPSPEMAVGEKVIFANSQRIIIGVLDDFHIKSLKEPYQPVVLHMIHHPSVVNYFSMVVRSDKVDETTAYVNDMYSRQFKQQAEYFYIKEYFDRQYNEEVTFYDLFRMLTGITILLTVFGLIGLSFYYASTKSKDIAIRKIFGATSVSMFFNLFKNFIYLVVIGALLSLPLFYYLVNTWLENYAFRINYSVRHFITPLFIIVIITFLASGFTLIKASLQNPVVALKES